METLLAEIFSELQKGSTQVKHPFRYFCLSSIENNTPFQRMVVFRELKNNTISIYTDIRTPKVSHFTANSNASVLLYDYTNMIQIQLTGVVAIEKEYHASVWDSISPKAQKDYTSLLAPGSSIESPEKVLYGEKVNFCILKFIFSKIDYLHIDRPFHSRTKFNLIDDKWEGSYVVP